MHLLDRSLRPPGYFAAAVIAADTSPRTKTSNVNPCPAKITADTLRLTITATESIEDAHVNGAN
jgi:hypothetical protein